MELPLFSCQILPQGGLDGGGIEAGWRYTMGRRPVVAESLGSSSKPYEVIVEVEAGEDGGHHQSANNPGSGGLGFTRAAISCCVEYRQFQRKYHWDVLRSVECSLQGGAPGGGDGRRGTPDGAEGTALLRIPPAAFAYLAAVLQHILPRISGFAATLRDDPRFVDADVVNLRLPQPRVNTAGGPMSLEPLLSSRDEESGPTVDSVVCELICRLAQPGASPYLAAFDGPDLVIVARTAQFPRQRSSEAQASSAVKGGRPWPELPAAAERSPMPAQLSGGSRGDGGGSAVALVHMRPSLFGLCSFSACSGDSTGGPPPGSYQDGKGAPPAASSQGQVPPGDWDLVPVPQDQLPPGYTVVMPRRFIGRPCSEDRVRSQRLVGRGSASEWAVALGCSRVSLTAVPTAATGDAPTPRVPSSVPPLAPMFTVAYVAINPQETVPGLPSGTSMAMRGWVPHIGPDACAQPPKDEGVARVGGFQRLLSALLLQRQRLVRGPLPPVQELEACDYFSLVTDCLLRAGSLGDLFTAEQWHSVPSRAAVACAFLAAQRDYPAFLRALPMPADRPAWLDATAEHRCAPRALAAADRSGLVELVIHAEGTAAAVAVRGGGGSGDPALHSGVHPTGCSALRATKAAAAAQDGGPLLSSVLTGGPALPVPTPSHTSAKRSGSEDVPRSLHLPMAEVVDCSVLIQSEFHGKALQFVLARLTASAAAAYTPADASWGRASRGETARASAEQLQRAAAHPQCARDALGGLACEGCRAGLLRELSAGLALRFPFSAPSAAGGAGAPPGTVTASLVILHATVVFVTSRLRELVQRASHSSASSSAAAAVAAELAAAGVQASFPRPGTAGSGDAAAHGLRAPVGAPPAATPAPSAASLLARSKSVSGSRGGTKGAAPPSQLASSKSTGTAAMVSTATTHPARESGDSRSPSQEQSLDDSQNSGSNSSSCACCPTHDRVSPETLVDARMLLLLSLIPILSAAPVATPPAVALGAAASPRAGAQRVGVPPTASTSIQGMLRALANLASSSQRLAPAIALGPSPHALRGVAMGAAAAGESVAVATVGQLVAFLLLQSAQSALSAASQGAVWTTDLLTSAVMLRVVGSVAQEQHHSTTGPASSTKLQLGASAGAASRRFALLIARLFSSAFPELSEQLPLTGPAVYGASSSSSTSPAQRSRKSGEPTEAAGLTQEPVAGSPPSESSGEAPSGKVQRSRNYSGSSLHGESPFSRGRSSTDSIASGGAARNRSVGNAGRSADVLFDSPRAHSQHWLGSGDDLTSDHPGAQLPPDPTSPPSPALQYSRLVGAETERHSASRRSGGTTMRTTQSVAAISSGVASQPLTSSRRSSAVAQGAGHGSGSQDLGNVGGMYPLPVGLRPVGPTVRSLGLLPPSHEATAASHTDATALPDTRLRLGAAVDSAAAPPQQRSVPMIDMQRIVGAQEPAAAPAPPGTAALPRHHSSLAPSSAASSFTTGRAGASVEDSSLLMLHRVGDESSRSATARLGFASLSDRHTFRGTSAAAAHPSQAGRADPGRSQRPLTQSAIRVSGVGTPGGSIGPGATLQFTDETLAAGVGDVPPLQPGLRGASSTSTVAGTMHRTPLPPSGKGHAPRTRGLAPSLASPFGYSHQDGGDHNSVLGGLTDPAAARSPLLRAIAICLVEAAQMMFLQHTANTPVPSAASPLAAAPLPILALAYDDEGVGWARLGLAAVAAAAHAAGCVWAVCEVQLPSSAAPKDGPGAAAPLATKRERRGAADGHAHWKFSESLTESVSTNGAHTARSRAAEGSTARHKGLLLSSAYGAEAAARSCPLCAGQLPVAAAAILRGAGDSLIRVMDTACAGGNSWAPDSAPVAHGRARTTGSLGAADLPPRPSVAVLMGYLLGSSIDLAGGPLNSKRFSGLYTSVTSAAAATPDHITRADPVGGLGGVDSASSRYHLPLGSIASGPQDGKHEGSLVGFSVDAEPPGAPPLVAASAPSHPSSVKQGSGFYPTPSSLLSLSEGGNSAPTPAPTAAAAETPFKLSLGSHSSRAAPVQRGHRAPEAELVVRLGSAAGLVALLHSLVRQQHRRKQQLRSPRRAHPSPVSASWRVATAVISLSNGWVASGHADRMLRLAAALVRMPPLSTTPAKEGGRLLAPAVANTMVPAPPTPANAAAGGDGTVRLSEEETGVGASVSMRKLFAPIPAVALPAAAVPTTSQLQHSSSRMRRGRLASAALQAIATLALPSALWDPATVIDPLQRGRRGPSSANEDTVVVTISSAAAVSSAVSQSENNTLAAWHSDSRGSGDAGAAPAEGAVFDAAMSQRRTHAIRVVQRAVTAWHRVFSLPSAQLGENQAFADPSATTAALRALLFLHSRPGTSARSHGPWRAPEELDLLLPPLQAAVQASGSNSVKVPQPANSRANDTPSTALLMMMAAYRTLSVATTALSTLSGLSAPLDAMPDHMGSLPGIQSNLESIPRSIPSFFASTVSPLSLPSFVHVAALMLLPRVLASVPCVVSSGASRFSVPAATEASSVIAALLVFHELRALELAAGLAGRGAEQLDSHSPPQAKGSLPITSVASSIDVCSPLLLPMGVSQLRDVTARQYNKRSGAASTLQSMDSGQAAAATETMLEIASPAPSLRQLHAARPPFQRLLDRNTATASMTTALISSGIVVALTRALSLEARARETWMRQQEEIAFEEEYDDEAAGMNEREGDEEEEEPGTVGDAPSPPDPSTKDEDDDEDFMLFEVYAPVAPALTPAATRRRLLSQHSMTEGVDGTPAAAAASASPILPLIHRALLAAATAAAAASAAAPPAARVPVDPKTGMPLHPQVKVLALDNKDVASAYSPSPDRPPVAALRQPVPAVPAPARPAFEVDPKTGMPLRPQVRVIDFAAPGSGAAGPSAASLRTHGGLLGNSAGASSSSRRLHPLLHINGVEPAGSSEGVQNASSLPSSGAVPHLASSTVPRLGAPRPAASAPGGEDQQRAADGPTDRPASSSVQLGRALAPMSTTSLLPATNGTAASPSMRSSRLVITVPTRDSILLDAQLSLERSPVRHPGGTELVGVAHERDVILEPGAAVPNLPSASASAAGSNGAPPAPPPTTPPRRGDVVHGAAEAASDNPGAVAPATPGVVVGGPDSSAPSTPVGALRVHGEGSAVPSSTSIRKVHSSSLALNLPMGTRKGSAQSFYVRPSGPNAAASHGGGTPKEAQGSLPAASPSRSSGGVGLMGLVPRHSHTFFAPSSRGSAGGGTGGSAWHPSQASAGSTSPVLGVSQQHASAPSRGFADVSRQLGEGSADDHAADGAAAAPSLPLSPAAGPHQSHRVSVSLSSAIQHLWHPSGHPPAASEPRSSRSSSVTGPPAPSPSELGPANEGRADDSGSSRRGSLPDSIGRASRSLQGRQLELGGTTLEEGLPTGTGSEGLEGGPSDSYTNSSRRLRRAHDDGTTPSKPPPAMPQLRSSSTPAPAETDESSRESLDGLVAHLEEACGVLSTGSNSVDSSRETSVLAFTSATAALHVRGQETVTAREEDAGAHDVTTGKLLVASAAVLASSAGSRGPSAAQPAYPADKRRLLSLTSLGAAYVDDAASEDSASNRGSNASSAESAAWDKPSASAELLASIAESRAAGSSMDAEERDSLVRPPREVAAALPQSELCGCPSAAGKTLPSPEDLCNDSTAAAAAADQLLLAADSHPGEVRYFDGEEDGSDSDGASENPGGAEEWMGWTESDYMAVAVRPAPLPPPPSATGPLAAAPAVGGVVPGSPSVQSLLPSIEGAPPPARDDTSSAVPGEHGQQHALMRARCPSSFFGGAAHTSEPVSYMAARTESALYSDASLHTGVITALFACLLTPDGLALREVLAMRAQREAALPAAEAGFSRSRRGSNASSVGHLHGRTHGGVDEGGDSDSDAPPPGESDWDGVPHTHRSPMEGAQAPRVRRTSFPVLPILASMSAAESAAISSAASSGDLAGLVAGRGGPHGAVSPSPSSASGALAKSRSSSSFAGAALAAAASLLTSGSLYSMGGGAGAAGGGNGGGGGRKQESNRSMLLFRRTSTSASSKLLYHNVGPMPAAARDPNDPAVLRFLSGPSAKGVHTSRSPAVSAPAATTAAGGSPTPATAAGCALAADAASAGMPEDAGAGSLYLDQEQSSPGGGSSSRPWQAKTAPIPVPAALALAAVPLSGSHRRLARLGTSSLRLPAHLLPSHPHSAQPVSAGSAGHAVPADLPAPAAAMEPTLSTPAGETFAVAVPAQDPWSVLDYQPVYVLQTHLNHPGNVGVVNVQLHSVCVQRGRPFLRLLRLLCAEFFVPAHYELQQHIASGAYGTVVAAVAARESPANDVLDLLARASVTGPWFAEQLGQAPSRAAIHDATDAPLVGQLSRPLPSAPGVPAANRSTMTLPGQVVDVSDVPPFGGFVEPSASALASSRVLASSALRLTGPLASSRVPALRLLLPDRAATQQQQLALQQAELGLRPSPFTLGGFGNAPWTPGAPPGGDGAASRLAGESSEASVSSSTAATTMSRLPSRDGVVASAPNAGEVQLLDLRTATLGLSSLLAAGSSDLDARPVAVKIVSFPDDPMERCVLAEVLPEVAILEEVTAKFVASVRQAEAHGASGAPASGGTSGGGGVAALLRSVAEGCPLAALLDFGVTPASIWIVQEKCLASLRHWRLDIFPSLPLRGHGEFSAPSASPQARQHAPAALALLLDIFACVVHRLSQLHALGVVHYDVKCDNVLLRPGFPRAVEAYLAEDVPAAGRGERWRSLLPFVCMADFGESSFTPDFPAAQVPFTPGRGTECIKAPELLRAARAAAGSSALAATARSAPTSARASHPPPGTPGTSGSACDVWSSGCLLFELLTGSFLFQDDDWARFYLCITGDETFGAGPAAGTGTPAAHSAVGGTSLAAGSLEADGGDGRGAQQQGGPAGSPPSLSRGASADLPALPLIAEDKMQLLAEAAAGAEGIQHELVSLLRSILCRDPAARPTTGDVSSSIGIARSRIAGGSGSLPQP